MFGNFFSNFFLTNETRYINSDFNLGSSSFFNKLAITNISQSHFNIAILKNLAVQPNHEKPGGPNPPTNKKIILSSFEYDLLNKHVDQQMGAVHPVLSGMDFKFMKVCTIILFNLLDTNYK